jgi:hypothetical protein
MKVMKPYALVERKGSNVIKFVALNRGWVLLKT